MKEDTAMRDPPLILVVDDTPQNLDLLTRRLEAKATRCDGRATARRRSPGWRSSRPT